ncbi:MAG TPA: cytochrome b/b6 domain-containing protein [Candidatus Competibacteraceae bacterium]|nr:cytochrome b/b6 domain-containing protein [Candidatus Competibacteraceae bacterium]
MRSVHTEHSAATVYVWDPLVRLFHWLLVAGVSVAWLTEDDWQWLHAWAGYLVLGLILIRIVWGFVGTRHARFGDFVHGPRRVLGYTRAVLERRAERYLGHNPAGGAMIIVLLALLLLTTVSGMAYYGAEQWQGPLAPLLQDLEGNWEWLEETHEFLANATLLLVGVHLLGVLWESLLHRENLVRAMLTGRKRL